MAATDRAPRVHARAALWHDLHDVVTRLYVELLDAPDAQARARARLRLHDAVFHLVHRTFETGEDVTNEGAEMKKFTVESECDRCDFRESVDARRPSRWSTWTLLGSPPSGDLKTVFLNAVGGSSEDRKDLCPRCTGDAERWFIDGRVPRPVPQSPVEERDDDYDDQVRLEW